MAIDPLARGGVRRYLDTVAPEEYLPETGEVNLTELTLTALADLYGSDKGTIKHRYTHVYERLIDDLCTPFDRRIARLRVIEAGVACGASLHMWSHYLPKSDIVGYDVRPECADLCRSRDNVEIHIGNPITVTESWDCDLFIDDASHIAEDIVAMFKNCWDWVLPDGYYVIEDLRCTYNEAYLKQYQAHFDSHAVNDRRAVLSLMDELMRVCDTGGAIERMEYYPQMLVIKKLETT